MMQDKDRPVIVKGAKDKPVVRWYVMKAAYSSLKYRDDLRLSKMEYFLPTHFVMQDLGGRRVRVEKALVFNFIFVRATIFDIKAFMQTHPGLHLVYRRRYQDETSNSEDRLVLSVGDEEMRMFAQTVGQYDGDIPFIKPTEVELSKGDHVRITEGPFAGVEGILMSQQGKDGGRVLVSISNLLAVPTLDIQPEYLEIIEFAESGKHMYKKFDSFMKKARVAMHNMYDGKLGTKDYASLCTFIKRFTSLKTHTVNAQVKLLVYMLICNTCLKNDKQRDAVELQIDAIMPDVKSPVFRALAYTHLYGCIQSPAYLREARLLVDEWGEIGEKEKTKREILEDLNLYEVHIGK